MDLYIVSSQTFSSVLITKVIFVPEKISYAKKKKTKVTIRRPGRRKTKKTTKLEILKNTNRTCLRAETLKSN